MLETKLSLIFKKYHVAAAYLFGSQANGKPHAKSDIDIAVRFFKEISLSKMLQLANELTIFYAKECDIVDLNNAPLPLQFRVYQARQLLYAENPRKEVMNQAKAVSLYFDYKYYYDRYVKARIKYMSLYGLT